MSLPINEQWRPVPGYEGCYEVSDQGRIRSVDRVVIRQGGFAANKPMRLRGRTLSTYRTASGHRSVNLSKDGTSRTRLVHHLVLTAFVGPMPDGMEGCHNNGDPGDNRIANLRWDTRSSNCYDKVRHGRCVKRNRTRCPYRHALVAPNLVASAAAHGLRTCLACSRARAMRQKARKRGDLFDFQAESDMKYARIMGDS